MWEAWPAVSTQSVVSLKGPSGRVGPWPPPCPQSWHLGWGASGDTLHTEMALGGEKGRGKAVLRLGCCGAPQVTVSTSPASVFEGLLRHDSLQILEQNQPCVC